MEKNEKYIKSLESSMKKYQEKIASIDSLLKEYKAHNKEHLMAGRDDIKEKLKKAEDIFKKLKSSSKENYDEIKSSSLDAVDALKEAFHDFSGLLTLDQLYYAKDEIAEYGCRKVNQVEDYIKQKPLASAACALGIGFLVGIYLMRSK